MPNMLFASNSISHFPGTEFRNDSWSYDEDRVPYSIWCPPETMASTPTFAATSGDETWFHFRCGSLYWYYAIYEPICRITDDEGNTIVDLTVRDHEAHGHQLTFNAGGQSEVLLTYFPLADSQMRTYDIQVLFTDVVAECRVYMNEILLFESTFSVVAREYPRQLIIGGHKGYADEGVNYSEIIIADGDTRNARLDLLRPVSAGAYGNWNGPIASLSDDDPTSGMTTTAADQYQSTILTAYGGADNISNVVQVTTSVRGINSPENLKHLIRMSAVDYLTADFAIPFAKEYQITDWTLNPATSLPWDAADLSNIEFGFKSIA